MLGLRKEPGPRGTRQKQLPQSVDLTPAACCGSQQTCFEPPDRLFAPSPGHMLLRALPGLLRASQAPHALSAALLHTTAAAEQPVAKAESSAKPALVRQPQLHAAVPVRVHAARA